MYCQCKDIRNINLAKKRKNSHRIQMQSHLHFCIHFFAVKKYEITTSKDHMTKWKRGENFCDMLQRLTKLNEYDTCVNGCAEVN